MNKIFTLIFLTIFYLIIFSFNSHADTLTIKDGSILYGKVISKDKDKLKFKTDYAGVIDIKWNKVEELKTDKPIKVLLINDKLILTTDIKNTDKGMSQIMKDEQQWDTAFNSEHLLFINPEPWRLDQGYKISGIVNLSLKTQSGNTNKSELEGDGNIELRGFDDRYTLLAELEHDYTDKKKSADNWKFSGKYDYFITKKQYYGLWLGLERDIFSDLKRRTSIGPHIGYQFYESKPLNLRAELGLSKVYENYIKAKNVDYGAINWFINYDQYFAYDFTQFYHKQNGMWNFEDNRKLTFNSWTGFRFPLSSGIVASAELELEYDSHPYNDIHKTDKTYRFKLGYQW
jgi:putative salt-induced outer membrane protein YdiY